MSPQLNADVESVIMEFHNPGTCQYDRFIQDLNDVFNASWEGHYERLALFEHYGRNQSPYGIYNVIESQVARWACAGMQFGTLDPEEFYIPFEDDPLYTEDFLPRGVPEWALNEMRIAAAAQQHVESLIMEFHNPGL